VECIPEQYERATGRLSRANVKTTLE